MFGKITYLTRNKLLTFGRFVWWLRYISVELQNSHTTGGSKRSFQIIKWLVAIPANNLSSLYHSNVARSAPCPAIKKNISRINLLFCAHYVRSWFYTNFQIETP